jgi:hypothetical protein
MPKAAWCDVCAAHVWLDAEGACANGHDASHVSNVYEVDPKPDPLREVGEVFKRAADEAGEALGQAGSSLKEAWREAEPSAKEAADSAGEAARKAAEAAAAFGRRIVGSGPTGSPPEPPPAPEAPEPPAPMPPDDDRS